MPFTKLHYLGDNNINVKIIHQITVNDRYISKTCNKQEAAKTINEYKKINCSLSVSNQVDK